LKLALPLSPSPASPSGSWGPFRLHRGAPPAPPTASPSPSPSTSHRPSLRRLADSLPSSLSLSSILIKIKKK
jgi:hypothetical protein